ncbi:MAG TPA: hydantoinase B/oxoprolinase family protein [Planctomycetaceae bacterium]|jgi:5-oxoprolinase (ATP-hydrolysing)|nr:hydantoinase B/oxoprolinase family protein [Planctomycetaceae bacterium]
MSDWEFWIDVGGTFTDCLARAPDGHVLTRKVLSSGVTKGAVAASSTGSTFSDELRRGDPPDFWHGYEAMFGDASGAVLHRDHIAAFDARSGQFTLAHPLSRPLEPGTRYELSSGEDAPLLAIRLVLDLKLDDRLPPMLVKLGTTRGTNALLTRSGARTAFVTTRGFADVLRIANQDRPRLFDLEIKKPEPLFSSVVEIDERLDAFGAVLRAPNPADIRKDLAKLKEDGTESLAICLLHAFANPAHEELVAHIARDVGFVEVSTSSKLSPLIKIVSRGDTTVVDAYLNPVLRDYVDRLSRALGSGQLKLMTSAGGLVDAGRFVGKDSILSGPAGGVIGFSRVAQRAGFERSIGFDMGGTSTDVSRFAGEYEREFEVQKAGVRIVAPMLAVETVAAGGGSICDFDGVKLIVGPASAGAVPGPACYGRGGPLTVTDANLILGKLPPERFPFPLDHQAAQQRIADLCKRIAASPNGRQLSATELAQGFIDVANANMARAIHRISVAKGYDPADYVLVAFGGAGGQHACAVARELGIRKILISPQAGVLSAYGIGLADVRRYAERSVLQPHSPHTLAQLEPVWRELEEHARHEVLADGVSHENVAPPARSLDMRYRGVEASLNVSLPDDGDFASRYEQLHEQLYGYRHTGREIEITAARVEVVGALPAPEETAAQLTQRHPKAKTSTDVIFVSRVHRTPVFLRDDLQPGDEFDGPAIVCEPTSTVVVDPGFQATILARGELLLTDAVPPKTVSLSTDVDPIQLEIFNNLFASIAEQMGTTLERTAISTNVKERRDFSCAIFSAHGHLVVNAPHIPVHLGAMGETVKHVLSEAGDIAPGDVFVTNDPYRGGSHLPDVTVVTPVHDPNTGKLLFATASRAHHAEIGGIIPGSMPPFSRVLGDEGVLISNFKLVDGGRSREAELRNLLLAGPHPTRNVHDNLTDVAAQVAANAVGANQLRRLVERYSLPVVAAYMEHIQQAAAQKMRSALFRIPDGTYSHTDHLDDGTPICVAITKTGDRAVVDFTGTGPVLATNLNANRAIVTAAVLYVFRCLIDEDIPLNGGVLEPVDIILPTCLLNPTPAADPAISPAVVGGNVETSQRVVDTLLGALRAAAASQGTMNNLTFGDSTFGYYETICGGSGATKNSAGADAVHTHMTNTRLTDPEVIERRYPVRVHEFCIRRGSGGTGHHRGGDGVVRRLEFLRSLIVSMLSERREAFAPFGLEGGNAGARGRNTLQRVGSAQSEDLGGKFAIEVQPGDVLTIETPGGGGFGQAKSTGHA